MKGVREGTGGTGDEGTGGTGDGGSVKGLSKSY